jgi:hypothetical protein
MEDRLSVRSMSHISEEIQEISRLWNWLLSFSLIRSVALIIYKIYLFVIVIPLFYIYVNGPSFHGYLFWGGKSLPDICASITKVDAHFWTSTPDSVSAWIVKRFLLINYVTDARMWNDPDAWIPFVHDWCNVYRIFDRVNQTHLLVTQEYPWTHTINNRQLSKTIVHQENQNIQSKKNINKIDEDECIVFIYEPDKTFAYCDIHDAMAAEATLSQCLLMTRSYLQYPYGY